MNDTSTILKVVDLGVALGGHKVLSDVDMEIKSGEFVVVVGPNGAGKTTLLRAVAGILPMDGTIAIGGVPLSRLPLVERARRIAYLPQGHIFHWPLAVEDVVGLGRLPLGAGADLSGADSAAVKNAMRQTGVSDYAWRSVTSLSGGERARVALARVLATEAQLILADEPTAALDPRYQLVVLDILKRHAQAGGTVVAVLHDLGLAARHADRIVVLNQGRIAGDGSPSEILTKAFLAEIFGIDAEIVTFADVPVVVPWTVI